MRTKLWRFHCALRMNSGIQMVVVGGAKHNSESKGRVSTSPPARDPFTHDSMLLRQHSNRRKSTLGFTDLLFISLTQCKNQCN